MRTNPEAQVSEAKVEAVDFSVAGEEPGSPEAYAWRTVTLSARVGLETPGPLQTDIWRVLDLERAGDDDFGIDLGNLPEVPESVRERCYLDLTRFHPVGHLRMYEIPIGTVIQEARSEWRWQIDFLLGDEISGLGEGEITEVIDRFPRLLSQFDRAIWEDVRWYHLGSLSVVPELRGQGCGRLLMDAMGEIVDRTAHSLTTLWAKPMARGGFQPARKMSEVVEAEEARLYRFYRKAGYRRLGSKGRLMARRVTFE